VPGIKKEGNLKVKDGDLVLISNKIKVNAQRQIIQKTKGLKKVKTQYCIPGRVSKVYQTMVQVAIMKNIEAPQLKIGDVFNVYTNLIQVVNEDVWNNIKNS